MSEYLFGSDKFDKKQAKKASVFFLENPHIFGILLGYKDLTTIHSEWIRYIWLSKQDRCLQAHRKSYKTSSVVETGIPLYLLYNHDDRIILGMKTSEMLKDKMGAIQRNLESKIFALLVYKLTGVDDFHLKEVNTRKLVMSTKKKNTPEGNLQTSSVRTGITSAHCERIHVDDIVTVDDKYSRAERENTKRYYRELQNIVDFGGVITSTGTPWHPDDAFSIMPEPKRYPIGSIKIKGLDDAEVDRLKKGMTESEYAANYLLQHVSGEDQLFKNPQYGEFDMRQRCIMYIDPAYMGDNKTAVTIAYRSTLGSYYVKGWAWRESIADCYDKIAILCQQHRVDIIKNEANADKGLSSDALREKITTVPIQAVFESANKEERITNFVYRNWGKIIFDNSTHLEYIYDIENYILGQEPDDAVDSLAGAIRELQTQEATVW